MIKNSIFALLLVSSINFASATEISQRPPFLKSEGSEWIRTEFLVKAEESDYAHLQFAIECNPAKHRVFFDATLLTLYTKSKTNPESDISGLLTKELNETSKTDWQPWAGQIDVRMQSPSGQIASNFLYFVPSTSPSPGIVTEVNGYSIKLSQTEMRPREVKVFKGNASDIQKAITSKIRASTGTTEDLPLTKTSFGVTSTGGRPLTFTFTISDLERLLGETLKNVCKQ